MHLFKLKTVCTHFKTHWKSIQWISYDHFTIEILNSKPKFQCSNYQLLRVRWVCVYSNYELVEPAHYTHIIIDIQLHVLAYKHRHE